MHKFVKSERSECNHVSYDHVVWVIGPLNASCSSLLEGGDPHTYSELSTCDRITQDAWWNQVWPGPEWYSNLVFQRQRSLCDAHRFYYTYTPNFPASTHQIVHGETATSPTMDYVVVCEWRVDSHCGHLRLLFVALMSLIANHDGNTTNQPHRLQLQHVRVRFPGELPWKKWILPDWWFHKHGLAWTSFCIPMDCRGACAIFCSSSVSQR